MGCVCLAAVLRLLLAQVVTPLASFFPFFTFFSGVVLVAWFAGFRYGVLALALSLVAAVVIRAPITLVWTIAYVVTMLMVLAALAASQRARDAADRATLESERLRLWLQQTLASIGDAVIATDNEGRVTFVNGEAERLTGCKRAEAEGKPVEQVFSVIDPLSGKSVSNPIAQVLVQESAAGTATHTLKPGCGPDVISIEASASPIRDAHGRITGAVLVFRDIGERARAQEEVQRSREDLASMVESIADGFMSLDEEWRWLYVNARAARLVRRPPSELIGKQIWDVLPSFAGGMLEEALRRVTETRFPERLEMRYEDSWIEFNLYPSRRGVSLFLRDVTENRVLMDRLAENEARFRTMADTAPVMIWTSGVNGGWDWFNRPWLEFTGSTLREQEGQGWSRGIHADDVQSCLKTYQGAFEARVPFTLQFRLRMHEGEYRWVLNRGVPRLDSSGRFLGYIGSAVDIHDMVRAAEMARENESRFLLAVRAARMFTWTLDVERGTLACDEEWERLAGSAARLPHHARQVLRRIHPTDRTAVKTAVMGALRSRGQCDFELRFRRADGSIGWLLLRGSVTGDWRGQPTRVEGVGLDVTESRRAEDRARQYSSIIESSEDAIVGKDLNGHVLTWNTGAQRLLGYTAAEAIGQHISFIIPPERIEEENLILERIRRGERVEHFETVRVRKDGSRVDLSISVSPIYDSQGAVIGASKIGRDITARKRAELELLEVNRRLRSSNDDLRQFAYAASHDLREPLRMVTAYTQLLEQRYRDALDEQGRSFAQLAVDAALRMERLLSGLLEYSQADKTAGEQPATLVDTRKALEGALQRLEAEIAMSGASVEAGRLPVLPGHENLFKEVFEHLIANALKYRGPQPPRIRVFADHRPDGPAGAEWIISVEDNGLGVDPRYHERIFGIFKRVHGGQYSGTGIGLAVCAKVISSYGGRIWVESTPGNGATFRFALPDPTPAGFPAGRNHGSNTEAVR